MIAVPLSEVVKCHLSFMINVTTFFLLSDAKPSLHLFGTEMSEILPFVRSPSSVISLYEKANVLITRMEKQGGNRGKLFIKKL